MRQVQWSNKSQFTTIKINRMILSCIYQSQTTTKKSKYLYRYIHYFIFPYIFTFVYINYVRITKNMSKRIEPAHIFNDDDTMAPTHSIKTVDFVRISNNFTASDLLSLWCVSLEKATFRQILLLIVGHVLLQIVIYLYTKFHANPSSHTKYCMANI